MDARTSIFKTVGRWNLPARSRASALRTATPVANGVIWWHSTACSEFGSPLLNGLQRSVNRKVQGSNPWSGAKSELKTRVEAGRSSWGRQQPRRGRLLLNAVNFPDGPDGCMKFIGSWGGSPPIRFWEGRVCLRL